MSITSIHDNQERIQLQSLKGLLVPFIGAGYSRPLYPEWADFLEQYFQSVRENFFLPEDEKKYLDLKNGDADNKFESIHFSEKEPLMTQLNEAFFQAAAKRDEKLIDWLYDLYNSLTYRGYYDVYVRLTQKVEKLFSEDKWTLRTVYAHRALILSDWGKLDMALALHKKQEQICEELGDRAGLAITWWNQGIIFDQKDDLKKKIELWRKSIEINKSIGIPTEDDQKALEALINESNVK